MNRPVLRAAAAALFAAVLAGCAATPTSSGTGEWFDDSWITTKVKSQILGDGFSNGVSINVETFRGNVQLSGFADTQGDIDRAVKLARETAGVKGVKNDVRLKPAQK
jgi:osmotically-inducible protein OsmY